MPDPIRASGHQGGDSTQRVKLEQAWALAADPELASQTSVTSVRLGVVTIAVGNSILLHELGFRRRELLGALREHVAAINDLRFRFGMVATLFSPSRRKRGIPMSAALQQRPQAAPSQQTAETPLLDQILEKSCQRLDSLAAGYSRAILEADGRVRRAVLLADGVEQIRQALTPEVMKRIMKLQGSRLGFQTDKDDDGGYPETVVRECLIEGLLRGTFPFRNEFNIIAGACYITQEGYRRLVSEIPGLTDLEEASGVPGPHNGQTCVRYAVRWRYNGVPGQLTDGDGKAGRVFPVRVNKSMGVDAVIGKARRKALKAVYEQVLGSEHSLPDGDEPEETPAAAAAEPEAGEGASTGGQQP